MSGEQDSEKEILTQPVRELLGLALGVLGDLDVEGTLTRVLTAAQDLTGARYAALGVLDPAGRSLSRFVTRGIDPSTATAIGAPPTGHGLLGELIARPSPLRVAHIGSHPRSYGFPHGHPPMTTFLGVPVTVGGRAYGNLYVCDKADGSEFSGDDEDSLVALAGFAGVAIDHARRFSGADDQRNELKRDVETLDATVQITRALAGATDLSVVLPLAAKRARALVHARACLIALVHEGTIQVVATAGEAPEWIVGRHLSLDGSEAALALSTQRPARLGAEVADGRSAERGLGRYGLGASDGLVVPLLSRGRAVGALIVLDRVIDGPQFNADDERILEGFAVAAANVVATVQAFDADRRSHRLAAAEQERARWARDLHDETLQSLAATRLGLEHARRRGTLQALDEAVATAVDQVSADMRDLRALVADLRPPALDDAGVGPAIDDLARRSGDRGLHVEIDLDLAFERGRSGRRLTAELEIAVYRIVQEALTNARVHGRAARAIVQVTDHAPAVEVMVRDNGDGFDGEQPVSGFGLVGMRERAELLGGTLIVASRPGHGTVVRASLPLAREAPTGEAGGRACGDPRQTA